MTAPYQPHSETSRAAAEAIAPSLNELQAVVYEAIKAAGLEGRTDDELQVELGMNPSTERPRRIEVEKYGLVTDSGRTRPTRSGKQAHVWVEAKPKDVGMSESRRGDGVVAARVKLPTRTLTDETGMGRYPQPDGGSPLMYTASDQQGKQADSHSNRRAATQTVQPKARRQRLLAGCDVHGQDRETVRARWDVASTAKVPAGKVILACECCDGPSMGALRAAYDEAGNELPGGVADPVNCSKCEVTA